MAETHFFVCVSGFPRFGTIISSGGIPRISEALSLSVCRPKRFGNQTLCCTTSKFSVRYGPFSEDCDDAFNCHQHRKSSSFSYLYFFLLCTFITLFFVLYYHQITKKLVNANARVMTAVINLSQKKKLLKVMKTLSWSFSFAIFASGNAKKYICGTLP